MNALIKDVCIQIAIFLGYTLRNLANSALTVISKLVSSVVALLEIILDVTRASTLRE